MPNKKPRTPSQIASLAREHCESMVRTLAKIATSPKSSDSARVAAANALLDRALGKAIQATELTGKDGQPLQIEEMSQEERERRFPRALAILKQAMESDSACEPDSAALSDDEDDKGTEH